MICCAVVAPEAMSAFSCVIDLPTTLYGELVGRADRLVTGDLSNAHGPNEFLDLPRTARRVTAVLAMVLDAAATGRTGRPR